MNPVHTETIDIQSKPTTLPLVIAILRGIRPAEVDAIADALVESGIRAIEVPLNSPDPLQSISRLRARCAGECVIGAGTVIDIAAVTAVANAGGEFIVSPNVDTGVIAHALSLGLGAVPGFATATEAFAAAAAGATLIKLFPASTYGPGHVRALRSVLPQAVQVVAVGGIGADNLRQWGDSGIVGIGAGGELYRPGTGAAEVRQRAQQLVAAMRESLPNGDERSFAALRPAPAASR